MSTKRDDGVVKAVINCLDDPLQSMEVPFNPTSFKLGRKVNWAEQAPVLQPWTTIQFGNGASDTLQLTLLLDESESDRSVLKPIHRIYDLTMPMQVGEAVRPPCVVFSWENFDFQGVVQSVDFDVVLFDASGRPKRANVTLTLLGKAFAEIRSVRDFFGQVFSFL